MESAVRKATGSHYTPSELSDFVAQEIARAIDESGLSDPLSILDPACGDGQLLVSAVEALRGHRAGIATIEGFDTDEQATRLARQRLLGLETATELSIVRGDFLERTLETCGSGGTPDLFTEAEPIHANVVITNPPYVRTQVLGAERSQRLAEAFGLSGRVDIYHAFIKALSVVLRPGGIIGMILSNRFMTTKAGAATRRNLLTSFDLLNVWDFGDTRLFDAAVLPAVLIARRKSNDGPSRESPTRFVATYLADTSAGPPSADVVLNCVRSDAVCDAPPETLNVQEGTLDHGEDLDSVWRVSTANNEAWLRSVKDHTWRSFGDCAPIRVGVKTTADPVFIRRDWHDLPEDRRPELLRPLITHKEARQFLSDPTGPEAQILYTHTVSDGKRHAIDLAAYPNARAYLESHRSRLEGREYVRKAGRKWFEVWVPQDPNAWAHPKIIFRDISERPTFWMDTDGKVVNGDCYWMDVDELPKEVRDLILGVGNSEFALDYYDSRFSNRLYGGRRRFMTQYVAEFPLPDPDSSESQAVLSIVQEIRGCLTPGAAVPRPLSERLDRAVRRAFGV